MYIFNLLHFIKFSTYVLSLNICILTCHVTRYIIVFIQYKLQSIVMFNILIAIYFKVLNVKCNILKQQTMWVNRL